MKSTEWYALLKANNCLFEYADGETTKHFIGTSGMHLGGYCCCDGILCNPVVVSQAASQFATAFGPDGAFFSENMWPEVVVVPAVGEIVLAHPTATQLMQTLSVPFVGQVWADKVAKSDGSAGTRYRIQRPGFAAQVQGRRALIVIDYMNKMHSAKQLVAEVRRLGGTPVGVCAIVYNNTTGVSAEAMDVPSFYGLTQFGFPVWTPEECNATGPCSRNHKIVIDEALGHGADYMRRCPDLPEDRFVLLGV